MSMLKSVDPVVRVRKNTTLLSDYKPNTKERLYTGFRPWDTLTNGMYPGSVYLMGGNKGLGKSTISLMIASSVPVRSLIVSAEETIESIAQRGLRTGAYDIDKKDRKVSIQQTSCTEDMFRAVDTVRPKVLIIDSMNKFKSESGTIGGDFGSGTQMKHLMTGVIERSRSMEMVSIVIGQVRSDGKTIAGPNMIQHDVDCVIIFMKDPKTPALRRARAVKNRWGPSDNWVVMAMTAGGLVDPMEGGEAEFDDPAKVPASIRSRFASSSGNDAFVGAGAGVGTVSQRPRLSLVGSSSRPSPGPSGPSSVSVSSSDEDEFEEEDEASAETDDEAAEHEGDDEDEEFEEDEFDRRE